MEELKSVVFETIEIKSQDEAHAYASLWFLNQSSFVFEQQNWKFLIAKLIRISNLTIDTLMKKLTQL